MINTFTYSHATTPLDQSQQAYYLCYYSGAVTRMSYKMGFFALVLHLSLQIYACIHLPRPVYGGREGGGGGGG